MGRIRLREDAFILTDMWIRSINFTVDWRGLRGPVNSQSMLSIENHGHLLNGLLFKRSFKATTFQQIGKTLFSADSMAVFCEQAPRLLP